MEALIIGLLVVVFGNIVYLNRQVAKLANELSHIKVNLEYISGIVESLRR